MGLEEFLLDRAEKQGISKKEKSVHRHFSERLTFPYKK